ncbi:Sel1 domain protein repeat-containing protein [Seminavis robusta]|uniref:Sel1 domain protein repeat-containing protein n=1 Tax=Seminavis robusta TaxID=568900 RepID=A0A9N8HSN8_9STRA|nr:Sel1 domain protein repeat-containing protein [Seminavis robusta]|eukprot:Sro1186_g250360.1 Sel1 domain protein repeat-containing protein (338) ;mRNA; f:24156-25248
MSSKLPSESAIQVMKYNDLRKECRLAGVDTTGKSGALRDRLVKLWKNKRAEEADKKDSARRLRHKREREDETSGGGGNNNGNSASKRFKKSAADDLICPITRDLPWEPVTAEDGRVYERSAIEQYVKQQKSAGQPIKSPVTNEPIGERLVPLHQHRSLIETLIESQVIDGDLAASWNKRVDEAKKMQQLLDRARGGDKKAMFDLGYYYKKGLNGFKQDLEQAFSWYQRAHEAGCVRSTACLGFAYFYGRGVPKDQKTGIMFITMAAAQGSDFGAYELGMKLAIGRGLPVNKKEAIRWLRTCLSGSCQHQHLTQMGKDEARSKLNDLLNTASAVEISD